MNEPPKYAYPYPAQGQGTLSFTLSLSLDRVHVLSGMVVVGFAGYYQGPPVQAPPQYYAAPPPRKGTGFLEGWYSLSLFSSLSLSILFLAGKAFMFIWLMEINW